MARLIAFGDSFTYGHGLDDCHIPPGLAGPTPSKLAWPNILGDMLDFEVVNKAKPGHSNIQILRDILSFDFLPTDTIIVGWTYPERDYIFKKNILGIDMSFKISPWIEDKTIIKKWLSIHTELDLSIRAGLHIHHADCFLKTKQIKQYHFCAHRNILTTTPEFTITPENFLNTKILPRMDKGLDNSHPGPESHRQAAKNLYKIINE
jgi:hypothetical protein